MQLAEVEPELSTKRQWQAVAGRRALRMLEIEEAAGRT
jgi:hypothetical protein